MFMYPLLSEYDEELCRNIRTNEAVLAALKDGQAHGHGNIKIYSFVSMIKVYVYYMCSIDFIGMLLQCIIREQLLVQCTL